MPKAKIITGLDIGTGSIKGLTVLKRFDSEDFEVLSRVSRPNSGVRRGQVTKPEEVSQNIDIVLKELQAQSQTKIKEVYVNIGGSHISPISSKGSIVVSRADQKISKEDVDRVIQSAKIFSLPPNKEIIDFFPKQFIVDGEMVKEPAGMTGIRLEAEILALSVFSPYFKNLTGAVLLGGGVKIADVICSPIASAKACLTPQQKELGAVLLDIGAGTTGIAIYEEGDLIHVAVLPVGSANITNDIAIGFRTDTEIAERIKLEFGSCLGPRNRPRSKEIFFSLRDKGEGEGRWKKAEKKSAGTPKEKIKLPSVPLNFSSKFLRKVIESRASEIFDLAQKEIKKVSSGILPGGAVITGGGAKLVGIVDLAKQKLRLPGKIGTPNYLPAQIPPFPKKEWDWEERDWEEGFPASIEEDPSFSTVWGLVLSGTEDRPVKSFEGVGNKIKKLFKVFIP